MKIAISSAHGLKVRGASGIIDEVDESRKVVPAVAKFLRAQGVRVETFNDDTSTTQEENLATIVDWTNQAFDGGADLAVSVHFNAAEPTTGARGTEVWFVSQEDLAADLSYAMSVAGDLTDRGAKFSDSLYFLNNTSMPAVLLEVCFVDAEVDCDHYEQFFDNICEAIADTLAESELVA